MSDLHDECGVAAIYHLPGRGMSPLCADSDRKTLSRLDAADAPGHPEPRPAGGRNDYLQSPAEASSIDTYKDVGTVTEVFRMSHRGRIRGPDEGIRPDGRRSATSATPPAAPRTAATPSPSSGTTSRSTSGSASPSTANWPTTSELRRRVAGRPRQPPRAGNRHRDHHARDLHGGVRRSPPAADRRSSPVGGEVRRCLQRRVSRRPGRHGGRAGPVGNQAPVLCGSRGRCSPRPARAWPC